jgi:phosphatidylglycerophosphatase A
MKPNDANRQARGLPRSHPAWWISCVGGIGLASKAPGTWGSLAALPPSYLIATMLAPEALLIVAIGVAAIGYIAALTYVQRMGNAHDPQEIVIDEVAGQMLTLSLLPPHLVTYAAGFLVFRLLDIVKPFPVGWIDRNVGGAAGVMLDDVAAGVIGLVVMLLAVSVAG